MQSDKNIDRRKLVKVREFIYPIVAAVVSAMTIGGGTAFITTYTVQKVNQEKLANLENVQEELKTFTVQTTENQIKLAQLIGSHQNILMQLNKYMERLESLSQNRYTMENSRADKAHIMTLLESRTNDLEKQIQRNLRLIEKYHLNGG